MTDRGKKANMWLGRACHSGVRPRNTIRKIARDSPAGCTLIGKTTISMSGTFLSLSNFSCSSYCSFKPGESLSAFCLILFSTLSMSSSARSENVWSGRKVTPVQARERGPAASPLRPEVSGCHRSMGLVRTRCSGALLVRLAT